VFWTAEAYDASYKCAPVLASSALLLVSDDICTVAQGNTYNSDIMDQETGDNIDWAIPYEDDDRDAYWCTHANTETVYSDYECSEIKCPIWRKLDTSDAADFKFSPPDSSTADVMWIRIGRAKLIMVHNGSGLDFKSVAAPLAADLKINVYASALNTVVSAGALIAAASVFAF